MRKIILFTGLVGLLSIHCVGQADDALQKRSTHYIGVQANQLLRQLFNLGGTSTAVTNPYVINYSVNNKDTGWGFASGLGYTYNQFSEGDPTNPLETTIKDFFFRAGFDRKNFIANRWMIGYGFDFIRESKSNKTESNSQFGNFSSKTKESGFGVGPRFTLTFKITEQILLGTEATYYFKSINETREITSQPNTDEKFKQFVFAVPAVLYITSVL